MIETSLGQLEAHLGSSVSILRCPVDAAGIKIYIFPLLFFKRICDVWDRKYRAVVDEYGEAEGDSCHLV